MYQDALFGQKTMGDVDIVFHDGTYHLFHLVLPNHDFVAHAISEDGLNWTRVENALFIGHPGSWDDHMLWTMHISRDPWQDDRWRMFYTGISRDDGGQIQRVGCAYSRDLLHWEKAADRRRDVSTQCDHPHSPSIDGAYDEASPFPLQASAPHYESTMDEGRSWVSFRDPFYFHEAGEGQLLVAARVPDGPVIRRGCVGVFRESAPLKFELKPPMHHPGQYDDVEVPNLFRLNDRYFLVASLREDAKVRYWYADQIEGPWMNFFDNVLLPEGNYAARVSFDENGPLVWNFFTSDSDRTVKNLMPPPKRIAVREDGRLTLHSFEGFDDLVDERCNIQELLPVSRLVGHPLADLDIDHESDRFTLSSIAGFEGFLFSQEVGCFRFQTILELDGKGKCGILFRLDPETSSGYHISLDLLKGVAQLRAWGESSDGRGDHAFRFESLQSGYWQSRQQGPWSITLTAVNSYLEFSVDDQILLTLSDETYEQGYVGLYVESACLQVKKPILEHLSPLTRPTDSLPQGTD